MLIPLSDNKYNSSHKINMQIFRTLSNLQLNPGSSLATLSNSVRRKTMEKINSRDQRKDDVEYLVTDDLSPDM